MKNLLKMSETQEKRFIRTWSFKKFRITYYYYIVLEIMHVKFFKCYFNNKIINLPLCTVYLNSFSVY